VSAVEGPAFPAVTSNTYLDLSMVRTADQVKIAATAGPSTRFAPGLSDNAISEYPGRTPLGLGLFHRRSPSGGLQGKIEEIGEHTRTDQEHSECEGAYP
jgi:hypothetical protein